VLAPQEFPAQLRGPDAARLAGVVAARYGAGRVHAELLGRAARSVVAEPAGWAAFGDPVRVLQLLKYVWHILVLRGRPWTPATVEGFLEG
jgi:hypothetical protein